MKKNMHQINLTSMSFYVFNSITCSHTLCCAHGDLIISQIINGGCCCTALVLLNCTTADSKSKISNTITVHNKCQPALRMPRTNT